MAGDTPARPWPAAAARARLTAVPDRLRRLEPVTCLALAGHALAVQLVEPVVGVSGLALAAAVLVALGVAGLAGWRSAAAVTVRAATILVLGFLLMLARQPGSGYVLLWLFVIVAIYPLVLDRRVGRFVAVVVPGVYLALLPFDAADGPLAVALLRAVSLALMAVFVHTAAVSYRDAVLDRDGALALLDTFVSTAPVGLGFWDHGLRFRRLNEALAAVAGRPVGDHLGRGVDEVPGVPEILAVSLRRSLDTGEPVDDVELAVAGRVWTTSVFPVRLEDEVIGVGAAAVDVTEQRRAAAALTHSGTHDGLTGLPNRVLLSDRLDVALAQASRVRGRVAVLLCDVDRFKVLNDSLGHVAGDALLREVADRLAATVRSGDTVARLGGDEFAVVCTELSDDSEALALADALRAAVREPMVVGGRAVTSTLSVGVTFSLPGEIDAADMLRDADLAMYQAKDAGRDRVAVVDARLRSSASARFELHSALRRAVAEHEITVAYQPVLALAEPRQMVGVEALARWTRPSGPVSPDVFIPMAEDLGLIDALGEQVMRTACRTVHGWRLATGRPLTVAVNLSARQLAAHDCVDRVAAVLAEVGLPGHALQLEITESVLMHDIDQSVRRLTELRALGVSLAVDDFGTGYSSLAYLRDLPVDILKIDRSFTSRLPADEPLFSFIVALARAIGATTVVEGVETQDELDLVTRVGCDTVQGFFLSRPLTPELARDFVYGRATF